MFAPWSTVTSHPAKEPVCLYSKSGAKILLDQLVDTNPEAKNGHWYWTQPFLYNGHLQTMNASRPHEEADRTYYGRRFLNLRDGGRVSLDYSLEPPSTQEAWQKELEYKPELKLPRNPLRTRYLKESEIKELDNPDNERPLVISLHGLTGGSHESYVRATISKLFEEKTDFEMVVLTLRGCNRSTVATPQLYNCCWTADLRSLVDHVHKVQPKRSLYLVGYSLGASIVANYLGQEGNDSKIAAACIVGNPWDMSMCNYQLESTFMGRNVYSKAMARNLNRMVSNNKEVMLQSELFRKQWELKGGAKAVRTVEFDDTFTAPLFGFNSAYDYYRTCSSVNRLANIRTPSLVLSASDDPIVADNAVPYSEAAKNPFLHLVSTSQGGHLGWFTANGTRWHAGVIAKFFSAYENTIDKSQPRPDVEVLERRFHGDRFKE